MRFPLQVVINQTGSNSRERALFYDCRREKKVALVLQRKCLLGTIHVDPGEDGALFHREGESNANMNKQLPGSGTGLAIYTETFLVVFHDKVKNSLPAFRMASAS